MAQKHQVQQQSMQSRQPQSRPSPGGGRK
jgi:hypothetical protein